MKITTTAWHQGCAVYSFEFTCAVDVTFELVAEMIVSQFQIPCSPNKIVFAHKNGKRYLELAEHGKTLAEVGFVDGDDVSFTSG